MVGSRLLCGYLFQNRTLVCRSRELEGDGGGDEDHTETPSCSLMSFAEFNHGAIKNKVCYWGRLPASSTVLLTVTVKKGKTFQQYLFSIKGNL